MIQSQAANCKLPIRSEIYNCTFKNRNKVSIIIIDIVIVIKINIIIIVIIIIIIIIIINLFLPLLFNSFRNEFYFSLRWKWNSRKLLPIPVESERPHSTCRAVGNELGWHHSLDNHILLFIFYQVFCQNLVLKQTRIVVEEKACKK